MPGFKIDVGDWFAWSIRLNEVGLTNFYSNKFFSDYTPGYMYILYLLGFLKNLLRIDNNTFYLLLKLPAILAELIISIIIYKEVKKKLSTSFAIIASSFILFNPALIFNSSIWGQIDSVLTMCILLAAYFLKKNLLVLSSLALGVAFLIKPQTIAIFPIFVLFLIRNFRVSNLAKLALPFLATIFILSLPFFQTKPLTGLIELVLKTADQYSYTSLFAYNFWGIIGFWITDTLKWHEISYRTIGYILFSVYWIVIAYSYLKGKLSIYALAALALLGFYFLPTKVHERYLYPSLIFLLLTAFNLKSRLLFFLTTILSLIHFLNLYYVYVYYNEFYYKLPKLLYNPMVYNFLDNNGKLLSVLSTILFVLISINIIKSNDATKKA